MASVDARVLLTTGAEVELGEGAAERPRRALDPAGRRHVGHAAVTVCHGVSGTTLDALAAGVPLVVVPLFADKPQNAARVAIVGAGIASRMDAIAGSVERLLADGAYARTTRAIASEMATLPPVDAFLPL